MYIYICIHMYIYSGLSHSLPPFPLHYQQQAYTSGSQSASATIPTETWWAPLQTIVPSSSGALLRADRRL